MTSFKFVLIAMVAFSAFATPEECQQEVTQVEAVVQNLEQAIQSAQPQQIVAALHELSQEIQKFNDLCLNHQANLRAGIQINFMSALPDVKGCVGNSTHFVNSTRGVVHKVKNGQDLLEHEFIDEVLDVAHQVDPLLNVCQLKKLEAKWSATFPEECINILGVVAHDTSYLRDHKNHPVQYAKDLLKLKKDIATTKTTCPFIPQN